MNALEIKPGKYRTRDGRVAEVTGGSVVMGDGRTYDVSGVIGPFFAPTAWMANGATWHPSHSIEEHGNDLIERIEDESKSEEKEVRLTGRQYAKGGFIESPKFPEAMMNIDFGTVPVKGNIIAATDGRNIADPKSNDFIAEFLSLMWRSRVAELEAKIARLEAENESLSRQLRSRERNKEPARAGKVWRWSPMV